MTLYTFSSFAAPNSKNRAPERQGWDDALPLYGKVKALSIIHHTAAEVETGEHTKKRSGKSICDYRFNRKGNVTDEVFYNDDGSVDVKNHYKYEEDIFIFGLCGTLALDGFGPEEDSSRIPNLQ